jgi:predicted P-loop ATPase
MFDIREHLDSLTSDGGSHGRHEGSYQCPVCESNNFKVDLKSGKYHPFGCGCTNDEIREAVSPSTWEKPLREQSQRDWVYSDRAGSPAVKVFRIDYNPPIIRKGKEVKREFWQESLVDGKTPREILHQLSPYNWQAALAALEQGGHVLIVEGEACVDVLAAVGIAAISFIGGTESKHYKHCIDLLAPYAERLVVCPDRDRKGVAFMEKIATAIGIAQWLYPNPDSFMWKHLQKSGGFDVADWIADSKLDCEQILSAISGKLERQTSEKPRSQPQRKRYAADDDYTLTKVNKLKLIDYLRENYGDRIRLNILTQDVELDGKVHEPEFFHWYLCEHDRLDVAKYTACDAMLIVAKENEYNPILEYLESLSPAPSIDIDHLSQRYFGTSDPIYDVFLKRFLIGSVARAYEPGCKFDACLILQGAQGIGKSSFWRILASEDWFVDSIALSKITDKDCLLISRRGWINEIPEIESIMSKKTAAELKFHLSRQIDTYREPYGRTTKTFPRHFVYAGTTNTQEFLTDPTGSRRYWVIPIPGAIDLERIRLERDQVWAAAIAAYKAGEQSWLTTDEEKQCNQLNEHYSISDPWEEPIANFLSLRSQTTTREILQECLHFDLDKIDRRSQMRVADILKRFKWEQTCEGKSRKRIWVKKSDQPDQPRSTPLSKVDHPPKAHENVVSDSSDQPDQPISQKEHFSSTNNTTQANPVQRTTAQTQKRPERSIRSIAKTESQAQQNIQPDQPIQTGSIAGRSPSIRSIASQQRDSNWGDCEVNIAGQWQRGRYIQEHPHMRLCAKTSKLEVHHKVELASGKTTLVAEFNLKRRDSVSCALR